MHTLERVNVLRPDGDLGLRSTCLNSAHLVSAHATYLVNS